MAELAASLRGYVASKGRAGVARDVLLVLIALSPLWLCRNGSTSSKLKVGLCVAGACALALFDRELWEKLQREPSLRRLLALVLGLGSAWLLLRTSLQATWWIIDDHEIADALAVGKVDTLGGLWDTLVSHREVGSPPWTYPRYRPSYYTLRYIETYLWGFEAGRWYLARLFLLAFSFALTWQTLLLVMGPTQSSLTLLFMLTEPFWGDVFCRLGPSEQYALLGCSLFAYASAQALLAIKAQRRPSLWHWGLAVCGCLLASGSKENFVFVPGLLALLLAIAAYRRQLSLAGAGLAVVGLLHASWVMLVVMISVKRRGANVYGGEASLGDAPQVALEAVTSLLTSEQVVLAVAVVGVAIFLVWRRAPGAGQRFSALTVGLLLCMGVYALQIIVYKRPITSMRYAFPGALMGTLMVSLLFAWLRWEARVSGLRFAKVLDAVVFALATYFVAQAGFREIKARAMTNVSRSQTFSRSVADAAARLRREPSRPLLFNVGRPDGELEPLVSIRIFLQYYGVTNPVFVLLTADARGQFAPLLRDWSEHGLLDWPADEGLHGGPGPRGKFRPVRELSEGGRPFGVGFAPLPPQAEPLNISW